MCVGPLGDVIPLRDQSLHAICQERTRLKRCRCMSSMNYEVLMIPLTVQPANSDYYAEKGW